MHAHADLGPWPASPAAPHTSINRVWPWPLDRALPPAGNVQARTSISMRPSGVLSALTSKNTTCAGSINPSHVTDIAHRSNAALSGTRPAQRTGRDMVLDRLQNPKMQRCRALGWEVGNNIRLLNAVGGLASCFILPLPPRGSCAVDRCPVRLRARAHEGCRFLESMPGSKPVAPRLPPPCLPRSLPTPPPSCALNKLASECERHGSRLCFLSSISSAQLMKRERESTRKAATKGRGAPLHSRRRVGAAVVGAATEQGGPHALHGDPTMMRQ